MGKCIKIVIVLFFVFISWYTISQPRPCSMNSDCGAGWCCSSGYCRQNLAGLCGGDPVCSKLDSPCATTGGVFCCDGYICEQTIGSISSVNASCKAKEGISCQKNKDCSSEAPTCRNNKCSKAELKESCQSSAVCSNGLECVCPKQEACRFDEKICLKKLESNCTASSECASRQCGAILTQQNQCCTPAGKTCPFVGINCRSSCCDGLLCNNFPVKGPVCEGLSIPGWDQCIKK